eukprot:evm.model.scf_143.2 EVM.evm.TU.scf_143.2   scf_143:54747-59400(-)
MATVGDVIHRADALVRKYGKYDSPLQPKAQQGPAKGCAFDQELEAVEEEAVALMKTADEIAEEKNRAAAAASNAGLRRAKAALLSGRIAGLKKSAAVGRHLGKEAVEARLAAVERLADRVKAIPDGVRGAPGARRLGEGSGRGAQGEGIVIDARGAAMGPQAFVHTRETREMERDWEAARRRQDAALERIDRGVGVLGNLARDMQEELDAQNPMLDAMEAQLDRVGSDMATRNRQLKGALVNMRSGRNLCLDVLLIAVLLGLGGYIYSLAT